MKCAICKIGSTEKGLVTFTLEKEGVIIVFKNVPAMVCQNCGDFYLTSETTNTLLDKATQTAKKGVEFEIINLQTAA